MQQLQATTKATMRQATPDYMAEDWLTVAEVADKLRVSRMTVYRMVEDGRLPRIQVGKSFRISRSGLNVHLDATVVQGEVVQQ